MAKRVALLGLESDAADLGKHRSGLHHTATMLDEGEVVEHILYAAVKAKEKEKESKRKRSFNLRQP